MISDRESYSGYDNPSLELDTVRTQPLEKQGMSLFAHAVVDSAGYLPLVETIVTLSHKY